MFLSLNFKIWVFSSYMDDQPIAKARIRLCTMFFTNAVTCYACSLDLSRIIVGRKKAAKLTRPRSGSNAEGNSHCAPPFLERVMLVFQGLDSLEMWIFFLLLVFVLIAELVAGELLIHQQFKNHRHAWERDGRPTFFITGPNESNVISGGRARNRVLFIWLIISPEWLQNDSYTRKIYFAFRAFAIFWITIPLFIIVYGILQF